MSDWREQALSAARDAWHGAIVDIPEAVVDAVAPIIRADERERIEKFAIPAWREEIAQEIEAMRCVQCKGHDDEPQVPALIWRDEAARIARGGDQ